MKIKISIIVALGCLIGGLHAFAEELPMNTGGYYQLGRYNNMPIIWRCVSTSDDNGILMVSDKALCFKAANAGSFLENGTFKPGSNFWEETTIRTWLNSTADAGHVQWGTYPPDSSHLREDYAYDSEAGFLSDNNFSESERSVIKTVTQWQALPKERLDMAENGCTYPFVTSYTIQKSHGESEYKGGIESADELKDAFKGAMYRVADTVFLMNEPQVYSVNKALGTTKAKSTVEHSNNYVYTYIYSADGFCRYWLSTPTVNTGDYGGDSRYDMNTIPYHNVVLGYSSSNEALGIRPAFYLNEETAQIVSGSGTEEDPYVLDGIAQEGMTVFSNGRQLEFAQEPVIENDRTLVGMRAIFETLNAQVSWDNETRTAAAIKDNTKIELQIDNNIMLVNGEAVELETPARLINDNTMVPLRAISESLDAKVEWIEALQRIVIDADPVWVESDWDPSWFHQATYGYRKKQND